MSRGPFIKDSHLGVAIALGGVTNFSTRNVFGGRVNLPSLAEVDVVPFADAYVFPPDGGEEMQVVSSDAGNDSTLAVTGLGAEGEYRSEEVAINGAVTIPLSGLWSRINGIVTSGGEELVPLSISVTGPGAAVTYAVLQASQTDNNSVFTIPAGKKGLVLSFVPTMTKSGGSDVGVLARVKVRRRGGVFVTPFALGMQRSGNTAPSFDNVLPDMIPPLTDIKITAEADSASTSVGVRYSLLLVEG